MKVILKTAVLIFVTVIMTMTRALCQVAAQDPTARTQDIEYTIDKLGDAQVELTEKMNQAQWEYFKQGPLFNDPSVTKRDMERSMSTYVLEDFKRDIDDMNRSAKIDVKVKAFANYKGDGKWVVNANAKNPDVTKLSDNSYMIEANTVLGGQLVKQRSKLFFPANAKNIQQGTDSFGNAIFTYNLGGGVGSVLKWNNIAGVLLIIAAVVVFRNLNSPKKPNIIGPDHQIEHTGLKV